MHSETGFPFARELIQHISDWQRGCSESHRIKRGNVLKNTCATLPIEHRSCPLVCYRQIAIEPDRVWQLFGQKRLPHRISSWTVDLAIAKGFNRGVPPKNGGFQGVIMALLPHPDQVIVNLWSLLRDPAFKAAEAMHCNSIDYYPKGLGRWQNSQSEVVLDIDALLEKDVYSLGGWSSDAADLVDKAALAMHGTTQITAEQRESLLLPIEKSVGPRWLGMEATKHVLSRITPRAEALRQRHPASEI